METKHKALLSVNLVVNEGKREIEFSLDHMSKEKIIELYEKEELDREIKTLLQLAGLPGSRCFSLNLPNRKGVLVDRIVVTE